MTTAVATLDTGVLTGTIVVSVVLALLVYAWLAIGLSLVFRKTGEEPWKAWVPVYNVWTLLELGGYPGWIALAGLVPFGGVVVWVFVILAAHRVNRGFGYGTGMTVVAALVLPVWASIVGFGPARWLGAPAGRPDASDAGFETTRRRGTSEPFAGAPMRPAPPLPTAAQAWRADAAGYPSWPQPAPPSPQTAPVAPYPSPPAGTGSVPGWPPITGPQPASAGYGAVSAAWAPPPRAETSPVPAARATTSSTPLPVADSASISWTPVAPAGAPSVSDGGAWPVGSAGGAPVTDPHAWRPVAPAATPAEPGPAPVEDWSRRARRDPVAEAPASAAQPPLAAVPTDWSPAAPTRTPTWGPVRTPADGQPVVAPDAQWPVPNRDLHPLRYSPWSAPDELDDLPDEVSAVQTIPGMGMPRAARSSVSAQHARPEIPDDDQTLVVVRRRAAWELVLPLGPPVAMTSPTLLLGRRPSADPAHPGAQLVPIIDETRTVSKRHARLSLREDGWWIVDLGSTNGVVLSTDDGSEFELESGVEHPVGERFLLGDAEVRIQRGSGA